MKDNLSFLRSTRCSPSRKQFGDLSPAVAQHAVSLVDDEIFLWSPGRLLDVWIEVVVPALSALLPKTALQVLGHHRPLLVAVLLHELNHLDTAGHRLHTLCHRYILRLV